MAYPPRPIIFFFGQTRNCLASAANVAKKNQIYGLGTQVTITPTVCTIRLFWGYCNTTCDCGKFFLESNWQIINSDDSSNHVKAIVFYLPEKTSCYSYSEVVAADRVEDASWSVCYSRSPWYWNHQEVGNFYH